MINLVPSVLSAFQRLSRFSIKLILRAGWIFQVIRMRSGIFDVIWDENSAQRKIKSRTWLNFFRVSSVEKQKQPIKTNWRQNSIVLKWRHWSATPKIEALSRWKFSSSEIQPARQSSSMDNRLYWMSVKLRTIIRIENFRFICSWLLKPFHRLQCSEAF